jgi:hypothetical protein
MFTKNYQKIQRQSQLGTSVSLKYVAGTSVTAYTQGSQEYTGLASVMRYARCKELSGGAISSLQSDYYGLWFGRGATPATADDYTLEDPITSGLSISNNGRIETTDGESTWAWTATYTATNTSETTINIYELGLIGLAKVSPSNATYNQILMHRKVLTEPITISPNETKIISYSISFHQNGDVS